MFRRHRNVQQLTFVRPYGPSHDESAHPVVLARHAKIVLEIVAHIPLGRLGTGLLDCQNLRKIPPFAAPHNSHYGCIMHAFVALFFFLGQPFWEAKPPEMWTNQEIDQLRYNSPWAQTVGPAPVILVYFATAAPIEEAEGELRLRTTNTLHEPDTDYLIYLSDHREKNFVLAIPYEPLPRLDKPQDQKQMEDESVMIVGRKKFKMVGHFPPVPSDPVLRLVFPREIRSGDKRVVFRLTLPGIDFPDREIEFSVKDLMYHGKLEV